MEKKKVEIYLENLTLNESISISDYYQEKELKQKQFTKQLADLFNDVIAKVQEKTK